MPAPIPPARGGHAPAVGKGAAAVSSFKFSGARLCAKHQSQRCGWSATQPRSKQIRTLPKFSRSLKRADQTLLPMERGRSEQLQPAQMRHGAPQTFFLLALLLGEDGS